MSIQIVLKPIVQPTIQAGFELLSRQPGRFFAFRFADLGLGDSQVECCFFSKKAKRAVATWVRQSLRLQPVPEVGGFLLGEYRTTAQGKWEVLVSQFLAAKSADFSSPNHLVLGIKAMSALDDAQQRHPEQSLVGWFHTHPGHTPFLSTVDLLTHDSFFNQSHQIAVVLDSLTSNWDTGIFTRKADGRVNNASDFPKKNQNTWLDFKNLN